MNQVFSIKSKQEKFKAEEKGCQLLFCCVNYQMCYIIHITKLAVLSILPSLLYYPHYQACCIIHITKLAVLSILPSLLYYSYYQACCIIHITKLAVLSILPSLLYYPVSFLIKNRDRKGFHFILHADAN